MRNSLSDAFNRLSCQLGFKLLLVARNCQHLEWDQRSTTLTESPFLPPLFWHPQCVVPTEWPAPRSAPLFDSISNCFFRLAIALLYVDQNQELLHVIMIKMKFFSSDFQPIQRVLCQIYQTVFRGHHLYWFMNIRDWWRQCDHHIKVTIASKCVTTWCDNHVSVTIELRWPSIWGSHQGDKSDRLHSKVTSALRSSSSVAPTALPELSICGK